jgi:hypothetical protein
MNGIYDILIYIYMCVCVCVFGEIQLVSNYTNACAVG